MRQALTLLACIGVVLALAGCPPPRETPKPEAKGAAKAGDPESVVFSVAWCTHEHPEVAASTAAADAIRNLGCEAKGLVFYEFFPKKGTELTDPDKEPKVLPAIRRIAGSVPTIGCRARCLVNGGTMLKDTVAVLAIGGKRVSCKVAKAKLEDDRKGVGAAIAQELKEVKGLKLVLALSEMSLSFETKEGVSVEDFIRGLLGTAGKDVVLFGGNGMPDEYPADKSGAQFIDNETLEGHVVALGIGGPIAVHANHTNEFALSEQTVTVTKAKDKWVSEFDSKPAAEVYRTIRGMKPDEPFTSDDRHPIGVIVPQDKDDGGKVYLRMVLEEKDKALRFVAAVPVGTKVKILKGGDKAEPILESAKDGIVQCLYKAGGAKPLLAIISDCCARGMRLRRLGKSGACEIKDAILPALSKQARKGEEADGAQLPIFGFYAWGELGPIAGPFGGLNCMYQQHTFVCAVITEAK